MELKRAEIRVPAVDGEVRRIEPDRRKVAYVRFATFNASLNRNNAGQFLSDIDSDLDLRPRSAGD